MDFRQIDLPWLVEPPKDFRYQVRSFSESSFDLAAPQRLASCRLSGNQLHWLGRAINQLSSQRLDATRVAILSNGTTDFLTYALAATALRHGVWVHTISSAFDQVAAEALDPKSETNRARCDFVLLAVDHRALPFVSIPGDLSRATSAVESALSYIDSIRNSLRSVSGCTVIVQTAPQTMGSVFGSLERTVPGTLQWQIDRYNQELRRRIAGSSDLLLDTAMLAEEIGLSRWHDPTQWTLGKFQFALDILPLYADWVGRLIAAARGRSRKCLVLDLDNTIWGGVIGDDGLAGIVLGNGSAAGEAYLQVQRTALALRERGIILAVSSKNDDSVARSPFRSHPDMLLKEEHIAVFQANWQDKAANLRAIATTLNIGIDSLVFLDDNPAERAQVRESLPQVAAPELPSDPAFYPRILSAAGYFEATGFTQEDRSRAEQYQSNAVRAQLLGAATDLGAYLRSLEMKAIFAPFDQMGRARITQLINKSNQFNLTTRRYTESDIEALERRDQAALTAQVRLIDRFGDNGMIAVLICRDSEADWTIDTWLMSCRVLNRQVEQATLNYLVSHAKAVGVRYLIGEYLQTDRNGMVKEHYARLGFELLLASETQSRWRLDVSSYVPSEVPIETVEIMSEDSVLNGVAVA
jgi:FkbH-like protein